MPLYHFVCRSCGQEADLFLSLGGLTRGEATCPSCHGREMDRPGAGDAPASPAQSGGQGKKSCVLNLGGR